MRTLLALLALTAATIAGLAPAVHAAEPRLLLDQPGFGLELVAKEPEIVTPIAMAFDTKGRLLVIESHTHQRPDDYPGPAGDRIRMLSDSDRDGRLDKWSTFAEGFQQAMGLCVRPDGGVYLVTRRDVRLLEDTDGDGASDKETPILRLETTADYPHNGMSGIAFKPNNDPAKGTLAIGVGENFGAPYTLVGSDGSKFEMRDGAGNVFLCGADGAELTRVATGFWNPFGLCYANATLYCVDNDPDASPPCRLIGVLPAGDYGFRFQYGRAGVHPLLAWNGELPGTLPPICGVGEAPTAIAFHHDFLWVTSWGDHRIERYASNYVTARARAGSTVRREVVVQGDEDFRPTGCAIAPDGALYFADWVSRSYPVHGKGRIWRLSLPMAENDRPNPPIQYVGSGLGYTETWEAGPSDNAQLAISNGHPLVASRGSEISPAKQRLVRLQTLRWHSQPDSEGALRNALQDSDPDVRLFAVRWIADERLDGYRDDVAKLLDGEIPTERYFLAVLAAIEWLDGDAAPRSSGISDGLLRRELANSQRSPQIKALALRLISPNHEWLTIERLREYLASDAPELRLEAVRTLAMQTRPERLAVLAEIAGDAERDSELRANAVVGLAPVAADYKEQLESLAKGDDIVAKEAARVLRFNSKRAAGAGLDPEQHLRPEQTNLEDWSALLAEGGDAASGRRLFFTNQALCATCHQYGGRGGRVGPDLTRIGDQQSRARIIASIIQPSQEIAPHYQAWQLVTADGLSHAGLRLPEGGDDGTEPYADVQGRRFELRSEDIELRSPLETSIMPEGLIDLLTVEDLRDLVAFLASKSPTVEGTSPQP